MQKHNKSFRYSWTCYEVEEAESASLLLAADVIYSDDLIDALFGTLKRLMSRGTEKVNISILVSLLDG